MLSLHGHIFLSLKSKTTNNYRYIHITEIPIPKGANSLQNQVAE